MTQLIVQKVWNTAMIILCRTIDVTNHSPTEVELTALLARGRKLTTIYPSRHTSVYNSRTCK